MGPVLFLLQMVGSFSGKILSIRLPPGDMDHTMIRRANAWVQTFLRQFPGRQEILPVFSIIVFFVYSWALYRMFYQVPSWLYYMPAGEIFILAAYVLVFALFESLVVLGLVLLLIKIYPARFFREKFVLQGTTLVGGLSLGAVLLQRKIGVIYKLEFEELLMYPLLILGIYLILPLFSAILYRKIPTLGRVVEAVADRMQIFPLIYLPLSLVSLPWLLIRNLVR